MSGLGPTSDAVGADGYVRESPKHDIVGMRSPRWDEWVFGGFSASATAKRRTADGGARSVTRGMRDWTKRQRSARREARTGKWPQFMTRCSPAVSARRPASNAPTAENDDRPYHHA